jgi:hypothetical protein
VSLDLNSTSKGKVKTLPTKGMVYCCPIDKWDEETGKCKVDIKLCSLVKEDEVKEKKMEEKKGKKWYECKIEPYIPPGLKRSERLWTETPGSAKFVMKDKIDRILTGYTEDIARKSKVTCRQATK